MRRIQLAALVGTAILFSPATALAGHSHHKKSAKHHKKTIKTPAAVKSGTYKATFATLPGERVPGGEPFTITVASGKVSLPTPPEMLCKSTGGGLENFPAASFATPVALSASGSVTEQAPTTDPTVVGAPPLTGQSTFTAAFTKTGTASGDLEVTLSGMIGTQPYSCTSGKVPFTAKLG
jgi:hypothetical protein